MPADTPVTFPTASTLATPGLTLLHVPPPVASVNVVADRLQKLATPVIPAGCTFTVTIIEDAHVPIV